jgi:hypothetical protein
LAQLILRCDTSDLLQDPEKELGRSGTPGAKGADIARRRIRGKQIKLDKNGSPPRERIASLGGWGSQNRRTLLTRIGPVQPSQILLKRI